MNVVSLQPPADSQLAEATRTTCGLPCSALAGSLPKRVWFHLQRLPLLPNWLGQMKKGQHLQEIVVLRGQPGAADLGLACLAAQLGFPRPLQKGSSCCLGLLPANRYERGWVRRPWTKDPLLGGDLSTGVPHLTPRTWKQLLCV